MEAVSHVLILFILMISGYVCTKLKICSQEMAVIFSSFVVKITLPALLFSSFIRPFSTELLQEAGHVLLLSVIIYGISFIIAYFYPRILGMKGPERGVHRYAIIISNSGFIGYPMVQAILGPSYMFHAVIFNINFSLLAFSVCAWLIAKEVKTAGGEPMRISWRLFVNPSVIATILGIIFFIFSISLPEVLFSSIKMTGDITSVLCMFIIGINLAKTNVKQIFGRWQVYLTTLMRLIIIPFIAGVVYYFLGFRGHVFVLSILITAMPAGLFTSIFASLYDIAPEEAGSIVFMSTMLCMITIPVVVSIAWQFA